MIPCSKPAATEIVLVGSGLSLDFAHPREYRRSAKRIVIALNAVSGVCVADYVVLTDEIAFNAWAVNALKGPKQHAVVKRWFHRRLAAGMDPKIPWLVAEDYLIGPHSQFEADSFNNARTLGLYLAVALFEQTPTVKTFTYIGLDNGPMEEFDSQGKRIATWTYANRLAPTALTNRVRAMISPYKTPHGAMALKVGHYASFLPLVRNFLHASPRLAAALNCKSFFDWRRIGLPPRYNAREAFTWQPNRTEELGYEAAESV